MVQLQNCSKLCGPPLGRLPSDDSLNNFNKALSRLVSPRDSLPSYTREEGKGKGEGDVMFLELLFMKLDFSKAYDPIDFHFLFQAIHIMGFPSKFIATTQLFFTRARVVVSINGRVTPLFEVQQGIRLGCLLGPYLSLLCWRC